MRYDNGENRRKNPITRNSMFMSQSDFDYEMMVGRNYVEQDMGQTVVLYEVDLEETKVNDIYMDAAEGAIRFKSPVELPVVYELEDAELKQL